MMSRRFLILFFTVLIVALGAGEVHARAPNAFAAQQIIPWRGPGLYMNWIKILVGWLLFVLWVHSTDWVNRDLQELKLKYTRWNPIVFGPFVGTLFLMWLVPLFWISFALMFIAWVTPFTVYVVHRNRKVFNNKRVFTAEHLRFWFATRLNMIGFSIAVEKADPLEKGAPVKLTARGAVDERTDRANLLAARQSPGLLPARQIIADALALRSSAIMLDYGATGVVLRYMIDGVWLGQEPLERESADPALETLKTLAGLKPQERQAKQQGILASEFESIDYETTLVCQGTSSGERALVKFVDKKVRFDSFDDIGMRPKMQEELLELLAAEKGLVMFAAMPAAGLRSTTNVTLRQTDRLTRDYMAIQEEKVEYELVENIQVTTYKGSVEGEPAATLTRMIRMDPEVIVARDFVDGQMIGMLCDEVADGRMIISTMRAKDGAEALLRVLALGGDPKDLASAATGVLSQRLIRKLCEECKEAYAPPPKILQKFGIPEGRVQAFYRPPEQPEEVCPNCNGIGYHGRTAIFELMRVGDTVRKVLATSPKLDLVRRAARKDGTRSMQEEGILLVAKGTTSLPELARAMKP